ncbi:MAG: protein TolR [Acidiferrobacteraceae bacterium]|jgi:biopolymer transport protein TolR|nr:protein TolR [Acidiferrobacteraceae bacterium]|tara:strand:+ start:444 stop:866 length:423 start_codon:yes stop_codon:yes gene_type:complete
MAIRHHRKRRQLSEINVVPYIDVMLVLLVIFMVTAPLLMEGVQVDLPDVDARPVTEDSEEPFVVHVDSKGQYFLNDSTVSISELNEIRIKAAAVLRNNPETPFMVRGDRNVSYDAVVQAMVLLQQAGVASVGLVTDSSSP